MLSLLVSILWSRMEKTPRFGQTTGWMARLLKKMTWPLCQLETWTIWGCKGLLTLNPLVFSLFEPSTWQSRPSTIDAFFLLNLQMSLLLLSKFTICSLLGFLQPQSQSEPSLKNLFLQSSAIWPSWIQGSQITLNCQLHQASQTPLPLMATV